MRNGAIVATASSAETTVERMATLMLGEDFKKTLGGEDIKLSNPRKAISRGIVLIPEDREHQALS